jgi:hypothetical protein
MDRPGFLTCAALLLLTLAGCSWQQAFQSAQGWQRNQCYRLPEQTDRERCLASNSMSYDEYRRNSDTAKN